MEKKPTTSLPPSMGATFGERRQARLDWEAAQVKAVQSAENKAVKAAEKK